MKKPREFWIQRKPGDDNYDLKVWLLEPKKEHKALHVKLDIECIHTREVLQNEIVLDREVVEFVRNCIREKTALIDAIVVLEAALKLLFLVFGKVTSWIKYIETTLRKCLKL